MPQIIPIQDLKNTSDISNKCHSSDNPIFITKNGHGDMVIMSIKQYENCLAKQDMYTQLEGAESQIVAGMTHNASTSLAEIRKKYHV